jgi:hypothetical protein
LIVVVCAKAGAASISAAAARSVKRNPLDMVTSWCAAGFPAITEAARR